MNWIHSRITKRIIVFLYDLSMIPLAWLGSYWLRFNLEAIPQPILQRALSTLPIILAIQSLAYFQFGLYRGMWRFASLPDLVRIIKAVVSATCLSALALFLLTHMIDVPRSVFLLYGVLLIGSLGGSRMLFRICKDNSRLFSKAQRVLIVGTGQAGEGLARELLRHAAQEYRPVAFVDDNPRRLGQDIHGIRVVGGSKEIPDIVKRYAIELIFIAIPSASSSEMRQIVDHCERTKIPVRTLPSVNDIASGLVTLNALREVSLEDLLGRDPVTLDWDTIHQRLCNKTILVSGGGGSIGAELCRQIARLNPAKLIVIERSEFNLYSLKMEFLDHFPKINFQGCLLDVTDRPSIRHLLQEEKPEFIFHAAAYKHVPLLEAQIREAVRNNILGTQILAEEAVAAHVKTFVLISTDKAVNPSNVMGATKRAAEIFCQNLNAESPTRFITVRFGNVLGSAGSVVPLFRKQIASGGPVTVTHPEITRFFMTIPEASQLILQATVMGQGGEIFVLDMGEPIKIRYLAEQLIRLSGRILGKDIEIKYTGLRPGEKLYEELFHENEALSPTKHDKILEANHRKMAWDALEGLFSHMKTACLAHDEQSLRKLLNQLVPEYQADIKDVIPA